MWHFVAPLTVYPLAVTVPLARVAVTDAGVSGGDCASARDGMDKSAASASAKSAASLQANRDCENGLGMFNVILLSALQGICQLSLSKLYDYQIVSS